MVALRLFRAVVTHLSGSFGEGSIGETWSGGGSSLYQSSSNLEPVGSGGALGVCDAQEVWEVV